MAKRNGGIIGKVNTPTTSAAVGVWRLQDQFNAKKNSIWPVSPYSVDFLVIAGGASGGRGSGSGGGAGGYRNSYSTEPSGGGGSSEASLTFNPGTVYTVTVGAPGASVGSGNGSSGAGGKGVVILRMPDANYSGTTTGSPTVTQNVGGTDTVIIFNDSGSYTG